MGARLLNIGEAAEATGVSAKMIRHYEAAGLIPAAARSGSGYRLYSEQDLRRLRFVRHARDLGFSIGQIAELLSLWQDKHRSSSKVKQMAQGTIKKLTDKGFGFIDTGTGKDLFFHSKALVSGTYDDLYEGQQVEFTEGRGPKGPNAENVRPV